MWQGTSCEVQQCRECPSVLAADGNGWHIALSRDSPQRFVSGWAGNESHKWGGGHSPFFISALCSLTSHSATTGMVDDLTSPPPFCILFFIKTSVMLPSLKCSWDQSVLLRARNFINKVNNKEQTKRHVLSCGQTQRLVPVPSWTKRTWLWTTAGSGGHGTES